LRLRTTLRKNELRDSERTPASLRAQPHPLHGMQTWAGLPKSAEECKCIQSPEPGK
jgi:hypothetical protein